MIGKRDALRFARYFVFHPGDLAVVAAAAWRLRRSGWWRQPPFMPVPDPRYWKFRIATAFGVEPRSPEPREVVDVAKWSRRIRAKQ